MKLHKIILLLGFIAFVLSDTECMDNGTCENSTYPTATALSESQLNSSCVFGTYLFDGYCACWSGAYGKNCTMGAEAVCEKVVARFWDLQSDERSNCYPGDELDIDNNNRDFCMNIIGHSSCSSYSSWGVVQPLNTLSPPQMDSASFTSDNLSIVVSQPMVNGRADGAAFLNDNRLNATKPFCTYPVSDYIFKEVDGCRDVWRFTIPWNLASQCGWSIIYQEGYKVYKGQVIIHNHEFLENIMDCRFVQSVLRIKLSFQTFVQVSLSSVVYNQPNVQTAITQQIVAINLGDAACLQLTTVLNYPYELTDGDLVSTPPGKFTSHTISSTIESCSGTSVCRQRWSSCMNLVNGTCDLNGPYQMNFTKECRDSSIECPLSDSDKSVTVNFNLVSENFCAEITIDIGLYGTLQLYDMTFSHIESSIVVGSRSCFLAVINSDLNPSPYNASTAAILLEGVDLVSVTVRLENSSEVVQLYDSSIPERFDYNTQLEVMTRPQVNQLGFCYNFSDTLLDTFYNNNDTVVVTKRGFIVGGRAIFTTGATLRVHFSGHVKRGVLAVSEDQSTVSSTNQLDIDSSNKPTESGGITIILAPLLLLIITLFF